MLAPYQQEGFHALIEMSRRWNGGFLTDGVGLGKTFVGLMLTEYYAVRHRKNVLIMATKTGQDAVWNPELREKLPELFGQFSNVLVRAHTDLTTSQGLAEIEHLAKRADIIRPSSSPESTPTTISRASASTACASTPSSWRSRSRAASPTTPPSRR